MAKKYMLLAPTDATQKGDEWWDASTCEWLPVKYLRDGSRGVIRRPVDEIPPGRYEIMSKDDLCVGDGFEWFDPKTNGWLLLRMGDFRDDRLIRRLVPATDKPKECLVLRPTDGLQEGDQYWAGPDGWVPVKSFRWINGVLYRRVVDKVPPGRYRLLYSHEQAVVGDERLVEWTGEWKRIEGIGEENGPHHCPVRRLVTNQYMLLNRDEPPQPFDEYLLDTNDWRPANNPKHISCLIYRRSVDEVPPGRYRVLCAYEQPQDGDEIYHQRSNKWEPSIHSVMSGCHVYRRLVQPAESLPAQYQLLDATDESQSGDEYFIHSTQRWALVGPHVTKDAHIRRRRVEAVPPGKYRLLDVSEPSQDGDEAYWGFEWGCFGPGPHFLRRRLVPHEIDRGGVNGYRLLAEGEEICDGDELYGSQTHTWIPVDGFVIGEPVGKHHTIIRRGMKHELQNESARLRNALEEVREAYGEALRENKQFVKARDYWKDQAMKLSEKVLERRRSIESLEKELAIAQSESTYFKACYQTRCEKLGELEKELEIYKGMYNSRSTKYIKILDALKSFTGNFDELNQILADEI